MKKTLLSILTVLTFYIACYGQNHEWSHAYFNGSAYNAPGVYMSPDLNGGAYVVVGLKDSINPDLNNVNDYIVPSSSEGVSVSRIDESGSLIWNRIIEKSDDLHYRVRAIETLSDGSFYIIASIRNAPYPFDINPGPGVFNINNNSLTIAHYTSAGIFIDAKVLNIETSKFELFESDISENDELLLSGEVYYGAHFSNIAGQDTTSGSDERRVFTAVYNNNLALDWVDYFHCDKTVSYSSNFNFGVSVLKPNGKAVSCFTFAGTVTLNDGTTYTASGEYDFVMVEYNQNGSINQAFFYASSGVDDHPKAIAADENNNIALLLFLRNNGEVDITGNYSNNSIVSNTVFALYDDEFELKTLKSFSSGNTEPHECEFNLDGHLVISGKLFTSFDFDLQPFGDDFYQLDAVGGFGYDIFLAKYDTLFNVVYAKSTGSTANIGIIDDMKVTSTGDILLSGELGGGSADMDLGPQVSLINTASSRYAFAAKYSLCNTQEYQNDVVVCPGGSYTFPDGTVQNNIFNPLTREDRFTGITSCDSLIITSIQIGQEYALTEQVDACEGSIYTFPDGSTQTITGQVVHTSSLQTVHGCDSTIETTVQVLFPDDATETVEICSGEDYTFPDGTTQFNLTSQTVYTSVLQNVNGCDSIIETTISILSTDETTESVSICSGEDYTFPDGTVQTNITSQIVYSSLLQNVNGCDSVVETTLDVLDANSDVTLAGGVLSADQSGASYQWFDCNTGDAIQGETSQSFEYTASGLYQVEIQINGCSYLSDCIEVSVADIEQKELTEINLFPNPAESLMTITSETGIKSISIYSADGKLVNSRKGEHAMELTLNVSGYAKGSYILYVVTDNQVKPLRFIKQ